jgi:hypothetical protein
MDTSKIENPSGLGKWLLKGDQLTAEEKRELSQSIDKLANWFDHQVVPFRTHPSHAQPRYQRTAGQRAPMQTNRLVSWDFCDVSLRVAQAEILGLVRNGQRDL